MELIDRQDVIKTLRDTFLGDTYEIDVVACGVIENLPTVDAIQTKVLNKINELVSEGYTVCFKFHPCDCVGIEVTYDSFYHANYRVAHLDDIKPEHMSDCILVILDDLKHKIEQLKENRKQNEIV